MNRFISKRFINKQIPYNTVFVKFDNPQEELKAITFAINKLQYARTSTHVGEDFEDLFDDLVERRISLMGKDDKAFSYMRV